MTDGAPGRRLLWPLAPAGVFACLTALWISRVGIESANCTIASTTAAMLHGGPLPLAYNYKGGPGVYLLTAPFILAFGETLRALRISAVFWSAACVAATGLLAGLCSGSRRAGILGACLAAVTPGLSILTPKGQFGGCPDTALVAASLAGMLACARDPRPGSARLAGFLLGLALTTKSVVAGVVVGLVVFALANHRRFSPLERGLIKQGAACFAAPLLPYLWALTAGGLWRSWLPGLLLREDGMKNTDYFTNLLIRVQHLHPLLAGDTIAPPPKLLSTAAAVCAVGLIAFALRSFVMRAAGARRAEAFLWTLSACFFVLSPISPSRLRWLHLLTMMPILWAAVAASAEESPPGLTRRACLIFLFGYLAAAGAGTAIMASNLARTGAMGTNFEMAIVDIARHFAARPELAPVTVSEDTQLALERMIPFLRGRDPLLLAEPTSAAHGDERWKGALEDPASVFIVSASDSDAVLRREAARRGYRLVESTASRAPDRDPAYALYSVRR